MTLHKLLIISLFAVMPTMLSSCDVLSALISTDASRSVNGETSKDAKAQKVAKTKQILDNY